MLTGWLEPEWDDDGILLRPVLSNGANAPPSDWPRLLYDKNFDASFRSRIQLLTQWVSESTAVETDWGVGLTHAACAALPPPEREYVGLPEAYPYGLAVDHDGQMGRPGFRLQVRPVDGDGRDITGAERTGCFLQFGGTVTYVLGPAELELYELLDNPEIATPSEDTPQHLRTLAHVQNLCKELGITLHESLRRQDIIAPDRLSIVLEAESDHTIRVLPALPDSEIDPHALDKALGDGEEIDDVVSIQGAGLGGRIRIITESVKEGLQQCRKVRRLSGAEAEDFLKSPHSYLHAPELDLADFSDRVIGIGKPKYRALPSSTPSDDKINWDVIALHYEGLRDYAPVEQLEIEDMDALKRVERAIERSEKAGLDYISFGAAAYKLDDDLHAYVQKQRERLDPEVAVGTNLSKTELTRDVLALLIKENLESVDYATFAEVATGVFEPDIPESLSAEYDLYPHQLAGVAWLQNMYCTDEECGALLADDMGLGKTLQALVFLANRLERGESGPFLIVVPVSLLKTWEAELWRAFPTLASAPLVLYGSELRERATSENKQRRLVSQWRGDARLVITNYETVRNYQLDICREDWAVIVCDEAQTIKTPTAQVTTAMKALKGGFRLALTGTPVENALEDLWCIFDFLQPGLLGSRKEFTQKYVRPIRNKSPDAHKVPNMLRAVLGEKLKRRVKEDYLHDLPPKKEQKYNPPLSEQQWWRYTEMASRLQDGSLEPLAAIQYMVAVSSHPRLIEGGISTTIDDEQLVSECPKLAEVLDILEEIRGRDEKAVVYTRLIEMQRILQRVIARRFNMEVDVMYGKVPPNKRQPMIDKFSRKPGFNVIILSPEVAGTGFTITDANHVIHYTRLWNPAREAQATDRVYRIGQSRPVTVHFPIAVAPPDVEHEEPTIEERIADILERKQMLSRDFLYPTAELDDWKDVYESFKAKRTEKSQGVPLGINEVDRLPPEKFEALVAALFAKQGYETVVTSLSRDFGADVLALAADGTGVVVQCKRIQGKLPQAAIQEVLGATGYYAAKYEWEFTEQYAITNGDVSRSVRKYAKANGVLVIARNKLSKLLKDHPVTYADIYACEQTRGQGLKMRR